MLTRLKRMFVAALAIPVMLVAGCSSGHSEASGDVMFATMMIPHHRQAVELSDMALAKPGASPEVVALATEIKGAQQPEIDQMAAWLGEWGAPVPEPGADMGGHSGHMEGMLTADQMAALAAADPPEFDRLWLEGMIEHHQGAVAMAQDVLATTQDPKVRTLAEAIIKAQEAEIARMQSLLGS